ncbi:MAG: hypothetical protein WD934_10150 [Gemmatimonadales bacterium]
MQRTTILALGTALALAGCGGGTSYPAPADPQAAVRSFLEAVRANSITAMGELWGTERGPAVSFMERREMEQRLTVMRTYLNHDRYELVVGNEGGFGNQRVVRVRLYRRGCSPVVPFTVVRYGAGWLVQQVDLEAVGNPQRDCPAN